MQREFVDRLSARPGHRLTKVRTRRTDEAVRVIIQSIPVLGHPDLELPVIAIIQERAGTESVMRDHLQPMGVNLRERV
jgi:hypothetical protein